MGLFARTTGVVGATGVVESAIVECVICAG